MIKVPGQNLLNQLKLNEIFQFFLKENFEIRLIGGALRDVLLNPQMNEGELLALDLDFSTNAKPDEVISVLRKNSVKTIEFTEKSRMHGTIMAVWRGKKIEITTLRKDVKCDGRYAVTEFGHSWPEDALRRDFTINALSYDGQIHDYFNGLEDLLTENFPKLKFIGDSNQRIQEDFLRILRFFRFISQLDADFSEDDILTCKKHSEEILNLSKERVRTEFVKLLEGKVPLKALNLIKKHEILPLNVDEKIINSRASISCKILSVFANCFELVALTKKEKILNGFFLRAEQVTEKQVKKWLETKDRQDVIDRLIFSHETQYVSIACDFVVPKFPISGHDFPNFKGRKLGEILERAKEIWRDSNYEASKEQIIGQIKQ